MDQDSERRIYEAAQEYRNWPITDQMGVTNSFENMVATIWNLAIREAIAMQNRSEGAILAALYRKGER